MIKALKRWWSEFLNPELKCQRVGHDLTEGEYLIRTDRGAFGIVQDYRATRDECQRCKYKSDWRDLRLEDWYTCIGMSDRLWNAIRRTGYIILMQYR